MNFMIDSKRNQSAKKSTQDKRVWGGPTKPIRLTKEITPIGDYKVPHRGYDPTKKRTRSTKN